MSFTVFSVAVLLIFLIAAAIEIYRGRQRGFFKTLISLGSMLVSLIISLMLSPVLSEVIVRPIFGGLVRRLNVYKNLLKQFSSLDPFIEALACILVSTLVFVLLFFVLRGVLGAIMASVYRRNMKPSEEDPGYGREKDSFCARNDKLLGSITGAVSAVLITMVVTSPLMGLLDIAGQTMVVAEKANKNIWVQTGIGEENINQLKEYTMDVPGNIFYRFGGEYIYHAAASTDLYGQRVYAMDELETIGNAVKDFGYVYSVIKAPEKSHSGYIQYIESVGQHVADLNICHGVLAEFLSKGASAWIEGKTYMRIAKPEMNDVIEPAFDEVLKVCANTNETNVKENVSTLLNIYAIILNSGIMKINANDPSEVLACVEKSDLISKLNTELAKNPNTSHITVSSIAMKVLANQINELTLDKDKYSALLKNMTEAINSVQTRGYGSMGEQVTVLTSYAKKYIADYGITIPDVIARSTAEELLTKLTASGSEVRVSDLKALFDEYLKD